MMLNKVDLPQPDGPITAKNSPGATSNDTLSSAVSSPSAVTKRIAMLSATRMAGGACVTSIARSLVERVAILWAIVAAAEGSVAGAGHGRGHDGGVAGLDPHIDDGDAAGVDRRNGLFQNAGKLGWFGDRTEAN